MSFLLDFLKVYLESKNRISVAEFSGYHCIILPGTVTNLILRKNHKLSLSSLIYHGEISQPLSTASLISEVDKEKMNALDHWVIAHKNHPIQ